MLLGTLPALAILLMTLLLGLLKPNWGWKRSFVRSFVLCASYLVLSTEILSMFRALNRPVLLVVWILPCVAIAAWLLRTWRINPAQFWFGISIPKEGLRILLWLSILFVLILTALTAWIWQPNTWDSLRYHMPRVAHWAQQKNVHHYITGIEVQNDIGPFAGFGILHTYILSNGDRWANFIQWSAMFSSLIGGAYLARLLGGGRTAQILAVGLMVSLPIGIAQATSSMTDYVVAFFVLAAVIEVIGMNIDGMSVTNFTFLGLSVGLAIGTKPTAFPYLLPFAIYVSVMFVVRREIKKSFKYSLLVIGIILLLNLGHMTRNVQTFGNPIGANSHISRQANELRTLRGLVSNVVRFASLHAGTPWEVVNDFIFKGIIIVHLIVDLPMDDPRTTFNGPYMFWKPRMEELFVGNYLHAYLFILVLIFGILFHRKFPSPLHFYAISVISTFLVFSFVFKWQVFSGRFHLPFFILFVPYAARVLERLLPKQVNYIVGVVFIIMAWPWLFNLTNRPLHDYLESFRSSTPQFSLVDFLNLDRRVYKDFLPLTDPIKASGCSRIAIMIGGNGREYPIWANLGSPSDDFEIHWIVVGTPSEKYRDYTFEPCAVICEHCPKDQKEFAGLPLYKEYMDHQVFLLPE